MTASQSAAFNFVPLLARLVLGAAFVTAGWNKVFNETTYTGETLQTLRDMKVLAHASDNEPGIRLASYFPQDPPPPTGGGGQPIQDPPPGGGGEGDAGQDTGDAQDDDAAGQDDAPGDPGTGGADAGAQQGGDSSNIRPNGQGSTDTVTARKVYGVALALKGTPGEPYALYLAWAAALTELVGGALVLIGLFTRLGALGLAGVMVGALYLVGIPELQKVGFNLFELAAGENPVPYSTVFIQLSFLVLAVGLVFTGAGALSADRFLFNGEEVIVVKDED